MSLEPFEAPLEPFLTLRAEQACASAEAFGPCAPIESKSCFITRSLTGQSLGIRGPSSPLMLVSLVNALACKRAMPPCTLLYWHVNLTLSLPKETRS